MAAKKKQKTKRLGQIRIRFFEEEKKTSLCLLLLQTLCDGNKNNNRCGGVGKPQKEWVDRFNDDELHFLIWSFECNGQRFEPFTPPPPFFLQTFRYSLWVFFCIHTSSCFWGKDLFSCFRVIGLILCPADAAGAPAGKANGDTAGRRSPGAPAGTRLEDPPCRPEVPQRRSEHQRCRRRRRQQRRPR